MNHEPEELVRYLFECMEARDLEGMLKLFTKDAVVFDPHYPIPQMEGIVAIEKGLSWALKTLAKPGFTVRRIWFEEGHGVVEVHTHHVLSTGMKLDFEQVFLFELQDGLVTRLRAFVPYRPPGIGGWIARVIGFWWRLLGRK